jgi:sporulation protein YunB
MKRMKFRNRVILIVFVIIMFIVVGFKGLNKKVTPILMTYAKEETYNLATLIINDAISKKVVNELTLDNLFLITKDDNGDIVSIDFNSIIVNKVLTTTTSAVERSLKYVEQGRINELNFSDSLIVEYDEKLAKKGIFYEIPLGIVFGSSLFSNLGPKIPVKMSLVGSIISGVETKVTNYGINNALIEVYVHLQVSIQVILPFISDKIQVETDIPVAIKLIRGNIPEYYSNGNLSSPLLSIPVE